ncbi:MAG: DUF3098 domain-containing protein [Rhodothermales bacterium]
MAKSTKSKKTRARQASSKASRANQTQRSGKNKPVMVFAKRNYLLMILGVVLVIFGYSIMRMENEVDGIISLYVAPLILLGGYLEIIYAILWRPKSSPETEKTAETA